MTTTKRALTATAVTGLATALALVPATARAHHVQPGPTGEITSVMGHAEFTQLPTHDRVLIGARGVSDDGFGLYQIVNDSGRATAKVVCVTGSRATPGFTDAAIGLHINRSTIAGLPRGTDAIEYVRDGGRTNPDNSGLVTGSANCPDSGFTVPDGVLVEVPTQGDGRVDNGNGRWDRGDAGWYHGDNRWRHGGNRWHRDDDSRHTGYVVQIRG